MVQIRHQNQNEFGTPNVNAYSYMATICILCAFAVMDNILPMFSLELFIYLSYSESTLMITYVLCMFILWYLLYASWEGVFGCRNGVSKKLVHGYPLSPSRIPKPWPVWKYCQSWLSRRMRLSWVDPGHWATTFLIKPLLSKHTWVFIEWTLKWNVNSL